MTYDPFQRLFDAIDPVKNFSDADIDALVPIEDLLQRIQNQDQDQEGKPVGRFRLRIGRRTAIIATLTVLVVAGTAAAVALLRSPVANTTLVSCYSQDSLHSKVIAVTSYTSHPLATCQAQLHWKPVPKGTALSGFLCVLSDGELGGFPPSKEIENCTKMGLAVFNGRLKYPHVLKFEAAAHNYFSDNSCASPTDARKQMLQLIGKYGLVGWQVHVGSFSMTKACATFGLQVRARIVNIVSTDK